jgi:hypothetical protein
MTRALAFLIVLCGATTPAQEPPAPKSQILLNCTLFTTTDDLWADVREVDPAFKAIGGQVEKLSKGLDAESVEDRNKASASIRSMGLSAYAAIKEEREKTKSATVRWELDAILKDLAGDWPGTLLAAPSGWHLGNLETEALKKRLGERKVRLFQQPFITMAEEQPASIFVGEEMPAGAVKRRLRLDEDGKRLRLEEKTPARMLKVGFQMLVKSEIRGKDRKSVALEIAITNSYVRKPVREMDTPLGRVPDPEVIEIGVDLHPVLESGRPYVAGPFPAAEDKGTPWWILVKAEVMKP